MNQMVSQIQPRSIDSLIPYARNARTHSDEQVAQIAASLVEFGWTNPILTDGKGGVIAGHGRMMAARKVLAAGGKIPNWPDPSQVPTIELGHLTNAQRRAYVLADNQLATRAGWEAEILAVELDELRDDGFNLALLGFDQQELNDLIGTPNDAPPPDEESAIPTVAAEAITVRGDVWVMGRHRVMCGDCRDPRDVEQLLRGDRINLAVTSPPYAEQREYDASSGFRPIPPDEYVEWYAPVAANIAAHLATDGSYFCNIKPAAEGLDTSLYVFDLVIAHVRNWGWHFATEFCWERNGIPKWVTRRFKNQFEPVYQFARSEWKMRPDAVRHESASVPKARGKGAGNTSWAKHQGNESIHMSGHQGEVGFEWFGDNVEAGLAYPGNRLPTFASTHEALGHAAAFPVGLPEFFVKAYTDKGDTVFDPFMGSGSTLMAAERTGRAGRGTELSPFYCDVIVKRWQAFTGKQATLEGDGRAFDEIASERVEPCPA